MKKTEFYPILMSVFHLTFSESTETELNHGSVVDDLSMNISVMNRLLKMTHQHQVSSQKPFIMKSQMVDIVQNGLRSDALRFIFCVDEFTVFIHQLLSVRDTAGLRRVPVVDVLVTDSKIISNDNFFLNFEHRKFRTVA